MGRPKKILKEIEDGMDVSTAEKPQVGEIMISKEAPAATKGSNEFGDEYTMEVIADNEPGADIMRVPNKDPKFEYRFLKDSKENMSVKTSNLLLMKGGWQICPTSHLIRIGIGKNLHHPDGSYRVGELILAFMPKELFAKKMAKDRKNSAEAMAGVKRLVEEGDESLVNIKDVHGIRPGRMDGGRVVFDNKAKGSVKHKAFGTHNSVED